jgi:PAS domain S-box-containing protein
MQQVNRTAAIGTQQEIDEVLRQIVDSLPHGVVVVAADGTIKVVNPELLRQFGYGAGELLGRHVEELVPEPFRAAHRALLRGFMVRPHDMSIAEARELRGRRRDGSQFPVKIRLRPIAAGAAIFALAIVEDLTERLQTEEARRLAIQERIEFEQLVASLSTEFINLPADAVDAAIRTALQRIGESLELDRCTFFRIRADGVLVDPIGWARPPYEPAAAPLPAAERFPWALETVRSGRPVVFAHVKDVPSQVDRQSYQAMGVRSAITVPMSVGGQLVGAIGVNMLRAERTWPPELLHRLQVLASTFANVLARRQSDTALAQALDRVKHLSNQLQEENTYLRREAQERFGNSEIIGASTAMQQVMDLVARVASTDSTVLLLGETGTGKELFASEIHQRSSRRPRAMVRVNCSAIPATLIESELFGREKGAYTGAHARQVGRFELADQSTIFLDEIGELPPDVQVKLLRVLEERQIERLGSPRSIRVNARIIAATHRDLDALVAAGSFRLDLLYRLNVFPIRVPPLRERAEDIPLLVWSFVREFARTFDKNVTAIDDDCLAALCRYEWPGNIRELRNVVERAMIRSQGPRLQIEVPTPSAAAVKVSTRLRDVEIAHIKDVLTSTGWRIRGSGGAAERLGLKPTTLETRLQRLGLRRPRA